jgi:nicotinamidase/pyrazinamidase
VRGSAPNSCQVNKNSRPCNADRPGSRDLRLVPRSDAKAEDHNNGSPRCSKGSGAERQAFPQVVLLNRLCRSLSFYKIRGADKVTQGWVFADIDTQVDFMLPAGSLYVPHAEETIPTLQRMFAFADANDIPILSSADAHSADDPSFSHWPPHCVIGTSGQQRIPETILGQPLVIPNRRIRLPSPFPLRGQIVLEKVDYDISSNPNFGAVLDGLEPKRLIVFGVATEYCVRASSLALRRRGLPVEVVTNAIRGITEEGSRDALAEMRAAGIQLVTADQALAEAG